MNAPVAPKLLEPGPDAWLESLNAEQRSAATWGAAGADGRFLAAPQLVIAGAGTGKTAMLAHRVAHLVLAGVAPERIGLLTFSRRAAQEMTRRAEQLVSKALAQRSARHGATVAVRLPWAGTFHSVGARLLREHAERLGLDPSFGILDRGDAADLIDVIRHDLDLSNQTRRFPRKESCLAIYSMSINTGWPLEQVLQTHFPWCLEWADALRGLFRGYVARKLEHGVLDYDDLLLWWDIALREPTLAMQIGQRFEHLLVDEYQDTNALQARILRALKPDGAGLTVVGDDAQSIYAFRAADIENILTFPEQFDPPARRVTLQTNYRSRQPILDLANTLIAEGSRQYPKTLQAARGTAGARPRLVTVLDDRAQSDWIIDEILRERENGTALRRQAVLFRTAWHSDALEVELMRRNVPFVKYGGLKFLESTHVKDLLAALRWADNPRHAITAFRCLQLLPGIGPAHARRIFEHVGADAGRFASLARVSVPPAASDAWPALVELLQSLAAPDARWPGQLEPLRRWYQPLLEQRFDDAGVRGADLDMLITVAAQFESRERFLTELSLDPPQASGDLAGDPHLDDDFLILSTVHSAKGQEWDAVYLLNVADGNFPNEYATGNPAAIEEERRLLYVAATRARESLCLLEPLRYQVTQQARHGGEYVHGARSRFLTPAVLERLDLQMLAPEPSTPGRCESRCDARGVSVDVAASLRQMW